MVCKSSYGWPNVILLSIVILMMLGGSVCTLLLVPPEPIPWPVTVLLLALGAMVSWMVFDIRYVIADGRLSYRSGPIRGKIAIASIRKVVYDDGFIKYSLLKLGMDNKGLVIHYDKFNDIYLSPAGRDAFVAELKSVNPDIIIERGTAQ